MRRIAERVARRAVAPGNANPHCRGRSHQRPRRLAPEGDAFGRCCEVGEDLETRDSLLQSPEIMASAHRIRGPAQQRQKRKINEIVGIGDQEARHRGRAVRCPGIHQGSTGTGFDGGWPGANRHPVGTLRCGVGDGGGAKAFEQAVDIGHAQLPGNERFINDAMIRPGR